MKGRSSGVSVTLRVAATTYEIVTRTFKRGLALCESPAAEQPHPEGVRGVPFGNMGGAFGGEGLSQGG